MAFDNLFFDLDGTLTDPYEGISKSVIYALEHFGITGVDEDVLRSFIGPPLINSFMDYFGFDEEKAKLAVNKYRERYSVKGIFENEIVDGVYETLETLRDAGKKLYLATSKPLVLAKRIMEHYNLAQYFDFLGGADMSFGRDEKWQVIEYVFENTGITDRSTCVMIGDRMHDIIGANKCRLKTIGVLCGYGSREELTEYKADYIADSFSEIIPFIMNS